MKEQQIQSKIIKYLKSMGAYVVKVSIATKSGVPDIICCYKGVFIAIEVKAPGGAISTLQQWNIEQIRKAGGIAIIAYSDIEVKSLLTLL